MLYILDKFVKDYFKVSKDLNEQFNKKIYRVSDTSLTYRQINALDTDNLLLNNRKSENGWRKFSFKDLVYIALVTELKEFGLKHAQLKTLYEAFYKTPSTNKEEIDKEDYVSETVSEIALGCVFSRVEIRLCVNSDGQIGFYDPIHFILDNHLQSQVVINFSNIVNNLVGSIRGEPIPMFWKLDKYFLDSISDLTDGEEKLLQIIRDKDFTEIQVKKKDGKISIARPEKTIDGKDYSITDAIAAINEKDYLDITITKRDGKIVNYKIKEMRKL